MGLLKQYREKALNEITDMAIRKKILNKLAEEILDLDGNESVEQLNLRFDSIFKEI